ncbi:hypothetical protein JEZ13_04160 [bacterium]|nr:hypothetical protein [bacterium]MBI9072946.1 hypothetical protein [Melioribacteraceae bacterium]
MKTKLHPGLVFIKYRGAEKGVIGKIRSINTLKDGRYIANVTIRDLKYPNQHRLHAQRCGGIRVAVHNNRHITFGLTEEKLHNFGLRGHTLSQTHELAVTTTGG